MLNIEALNKMAEKFFLEGTENEAEVYFKGIINESLSAILEAIYDKFHVFKTKFM